MHLRFSILVLYLCPAMKHDIENRDDIILLVNTFYSNVKQDKTIGYIFEEVAHVNWDEHLPKMYSFWSSLLLGEHSYTGNPMSVHLELSKLTTMSETEFSSWLMLFIKTIDSLFQGKKADEAKERGANIARLMLHKIQAQV